MRWYLATDSLALRRRAREAYGSKVVTAVDAAVAHTRAAHARVDSRKLAWAQRRVQRRGLRDYQPLDGDAT